MWNLGSEVSVNLYNRTSASSTDFQTPLNVLFPNSECHIDEIERFGSTAYARKPITETKLSKKAIKGILKVNLDSGMNSIDIENSDTGDWDENMVDSFDDDILEKETENLNRIESIRGKAEVNDKDKKRNRDEIEDVDLEVEELREQPKRNAKKKMNYKAMAEGRIDLTDGSFAHPANDIRFTEFDKNKLGYYVGCN